MRLVGRGIPNIQDAGISKLVERRVHRSRRQVRPLVNGVAVEFLPRTVHEELKDLEPAAGELDIGHVSMVTHYVRNRKTFPQVFSSRPSEWGALLAWRREDGVVPTLPTLTRLVKVHGPVDEVPIDTTRGPVRVYLTQNPALKQPDHYYCYVAVADWMPPHQRVVMFVIFACVSKDSGRYVVLVFASPEVRYDHERDGEVSVPVQIGRWLFSNSHLTDHSADRTDAGERWAQQVGGHVPERLKSGDRKKGTSAGTKRSGSRAYAALCQVDWDEEERRTGDHGVAPV